MEKIGDSSMVDVSGNLNFSSVIYAVQGIDNRRDPFTWYANGGITFNILDVALPFTFNYSSQSLNYSQPFNMTALHPTYKWVKSHIGLTSMTFSPYTLSGHRFLGGGVELTPGNWNVQLMSGRLIKPINYNPITENEDQMAYGRMGYGLQVGYGANGHDVKFSLLKARDNTASLDYIPQGANVQAKDNFVASIGGRTQILKKITLDAEYALSALTENILDPSEFSNNRAASFLQAMVTSNATTDFYNAFNTNIGYTEKFFGIQFGFEHIDAGYRTLGGYFFNNDLQNYTLSPSFKIFKGKINIGAKTGLQKNNLNAAQAATSTRWIGNLNVSATPFKGGTIAGTYSNFSTFTENRPQTDPFFTPAMDTLNFYQVNQNGNLMGSYAFNQDKTPMSIQVMGAYQESENINGAIEDASAFGLNVNSTGQKTKVWVSNANYSIQFKESKSSLNAAVNYNKSIAANFESFFVGPTLGYQKKLFKDKGSFSGNTTYNLQYSEGELAANVMNYQMAVRYQMKLTGKNAGSMNFSARMNWLQRFPAAGTGNTVNEWNFNVNLGYAF